MTLIGTIVAVFLFLVLLVSIVLLVRRYGKRFLFIVLSGFGIYLFSVDAGIGIALSFIVIMTYLAKKHGDFKKKSV